MFHERVVVRERITRCRLLLAILLSVRRQRAFLRKNPASEAATYRLGESHPDVVPPRGGDEHATKKLSCRRDDEVIPMTGEFS